MIAVLSIALLAAPQTLHGPDVYEAAVHDVSPPLFLIPPAEARVGLVEHEPKHRQIPPRPFVADPVIQQSAPSLAMPSTATSWDGVGNGFTGPGGSFTVNSAPPDTYGDVGPNHYISLVNSGFAIFNKTDTVL